MCANHDISNIPFIMRGNHFLVHGHKKDLPHITCIFHLLKYVIKLFLVSSILHHISSLFLLSKSYFKLSTFQPNFLCSSSFKKKGNKYWLQWRLYFIKIDAALKYWLLRTTCSWRYWIVDVVCYSWKKTRTIIVCLDCFISRTNYMHN